MSQDDKILTLAETAEHLRVSENTVLQMVKNRRLLCTRTKGNSGKYLFRLSDLDKLFQVNPSCGNPDRGF